MLGTVETVGIGYRIGGYIEGVKERFAILSYDRAESTVLLIIVLSLTVLGTILLMCTVFRPPFFRRHVLANNMRRMWMYDSAVYLNVLSVFGIILGCFVVSVLLLALVGGIVWLLAWILKILFFIIIGSSVVAIVVGVIGAFSRSETAALLVVGIPILIINKRLREWGDSIVDAGTRFLKSVNMIGWTYGFVTSLWDVILVVVFFPVTVFFLTAVSLILFSTLLKVIDSLFTRIYSIKQPCPCCGSTKTPKYIIDGKEHPVKLQPGMFGVFRQFSPESKRYVPTMLLNGKGKLTRKCANPNCSAIVNPDPTFSYGTNMHIGIVGPRSSGKSYLLYSGLGRLISTYPGNVYQVDANQDTAIIEKEDRIKRGSGIQTNNANQYRAIQVMITPMKKRLVPYHLFFYDVAGEQFDVYSSNSATAMFFYQIVQSIVFIVDPSMIDLAGLNPSENIQHWVETANRGEVHNLEGTFSVLMGLLEREGRQSNEIDFSFICTKADLGYFEADNYNRFTVTEEMIKRFLIESLGLVNLVNSAENMFRQVRYYQISVVDEGTDSVRKLFEDFIEQHAGNPDIFLDS